VTGRRGRRSEQLLDDLKEKREYCKLRGEALDRILWGSRLGTGCGPVVMQTKQWMNSSTTLGNEHALGLDTF